MENKTILQRVWATSWKGWEEINREQLGDSCNCVHWEPRGAEPECLVHGYVKEVK